MKKTILIIVSILLTLNVTFGNYSFDFQNKILNNIEDNSKKELSKTSKWKKYKNKIDKINLAKFDIEKLNKIFNKIISLEENEKIKNNILLRNIVKYLKWKIWKEILNKNPENLVWTNTKLEINNDYQEKIEKILKKYQEKNKNRFTTDYLNWIVIDNKTWNIISLVWNYSILKEEKIGSLIKPFNYTLWIEKNNLTRKTKIIDEKTEFEEWVEVNNFDYRFMWEITIEKALNTSRNIPSIKMFHLWWWKIKLEKLLNNFWIKVKKSKWLDLALWETNLNLLKIVNWYTIFSNNWKLWDKQIIKEKTANIIKDILANKWDEKPRFWNKFMKVPWKNVSMKTGTSIIRYKTKFWRKIISPNNVYMIWFDEKYTALVWWWSNKWVLYLSANWLEWAWPSMLEIFKILK